MKRAIEQRLAAVEETVGRVAEGRRRRAESLAFWRRMKELSDETGHDLLAGVFPRGFDPTAPRPRGPRTAMDRLNDCLQMAHEFIEQHEAQKAAGQSESTAVPPSPVAPPEPPVESVTKRAPPPSPPPRPAKTDWFAGAFSRPEPFMGVG